MIGGLLTDFRGEDVFGVIFLLAEVALLMLVLWLVYKEWKERRR